MSEESGVSITRSMVPDYADATAGRFLLRGRRCRDNAQAPYTFAIPATGNKTAFQDIAFPHASGADLIAGEMRHDGQMGDTFTVEVNPNFDVIVVGVSVVSASGSSITVSSGGVATLLGAGLLQEAVFMRLSADGTGLPDPTSVDYEDKLYEVISWDAAADKITLDGAPTTPASGDHIHLTRRFLDHGWVEPDKMVPLGGQNPGGSNIPTGIVMRMIGTNSGTADVTLWYNLAILHGHPDYT